MSCDVGLHASLTRPRGRHTQAMRSLARRCASFLTSDRNYGANMCRAICLPIECFCNTNAAIETASFEMLTGLI